MNVTSHGAPARLPDIDGLAAQLQRDGYLIIPHAADPVLLDALEEDLQPHFAAARFLFHSPLGPAHLSSCHCDFAKPSK